MTPNIDSESASHTLQAHGSVSLSIFGRAQHDLACHTLVLADFDLKRNSALGPALPISVLLQFDGPSPDVGSMPHAQMLVCGA